MFTYQLILIQILRLLFSTLKSGTLYLTLVILDKSNSGLVS